VNPVELGLALAWVVIGLGCWLGYQLFLQNGRLLLRLEALEDELRQLRPPQVEDATGLPIGSVLNDFDLPQLSGGRMTLSQWRGRRVLLIFFNPRCGFCRQMSPELAALPTDPADGRATPLVLTTGDPEENRRLVEEHGIRCPVLLQEDWEVASLYRAAGTPTGYLIDEGGATASTLAVGAQAVLALASADPVPAVDGHGHAAAARGNGFVQHPVTPAPVKSRLNRDGLPAGTPAPGFRLPRLDGGELFLDAYRGRRVLLVFSDPACGPCDRLAPRLERRHRRSPDLPVLMVSRGDPQANRAKAAEHGLTFPIALQRHWEVSRDYGMFATPIGYLIDERGIIAADVAVGVDAILALASRTARHADGKGEPVSR
jgi:peroxiredoxin